MKKVNPNTKKLTKLDAINKDSKPYLMYSASIESIIKEMVIETGLSFEIIRRIVGSSLKFTNRVLKDIDIIENPITLKWIYLGQFTVSKTKLEAHKRRLERKRLEELNKLKNEEI